MAHSCGLRADGSVECWGSNLLDQLRVPESELFTQITAGDVHTCGLRADGTPVCWGNMSDFIEPVDISEITLEEQVLLFKAPYPPEGERFAIIDAWGSHTCGLRANGSLICWGLMSRTTGEEAQIPEDERFVDIGAGEFSICGVRSDGTANCWPSPDALPPPENETFTSIERTFIHACGLREDGHALCWGLPIADLLSVPKDMRFSAITLGRYHSCGLAVDGQAVCWGINLEDFESLQEDPHVVRLIESPPSPVPEGEQFTDIDAGTWHTCGVRLDSTILCWGDDGYGQSSPQMR